MKPYYHDEIRRLLLLQVLQEWKGTPFRAKQRIKGAGCDCVEFGVGVGIDTEHLPKDTVLPKYSIQPNAEMEPLIDWFVTSPLFEEIGIFDATKTGDHVCFAMNKAPHHLGIVAVHPKFFHCPRFLGTRQGTKFVRGGVRQDDLRDSTWKRRLARAFRPIEE